ncbi:hypothetical protein CSPHI_01840 [Corynebacterium sphenisci DSM 44792]|uniref:Type VII secretion-associated protein n=1 Tax=Corynebacterium sphenisci DSM 44792 TaxID=1437874 RepID=A0A1L7CW39_9CORY|nr:type VII secretion-associated protein [Corynebacterium sphenisci]APT90028.1 hypothetical protein CSPHI_01840 [Corynebacterium sphenisci DSM 44792]
MTGGAGGPVLHCWGPEAGPPEGDAARIAAFLAGHGAPELVIVPSYWGARRRELLARRLLDAGADPRLCPLAEALTGLEPPLSPRSVLVEVERDRLCLVELDYPGRGGDCRLLHRDGAVVDVVLDAVGVDVSRPGAGPAEADAAGESALEFIIAAEPGHRLVEDLRRRGAVTFTVPVPLLAEGARRTGPTPPPGEAPEPAGPGVPGEPAPADPGDPGAVAEADPGEAADPGDELGIARLRARVRRGRAVGRSRRAALARVVPPALAGLAAAALIAAAVALAPEATPPQPDARAPAGTAAPARPAPPAAEPAPVRLAGAGVAVTLPAGWREVPGAVPGLLVAHDGGPMRILLTAGGVAADLDPAGLAEALRARAAADPALGRVRLDGAGPAARVVLEERPGDGTVVLWRHRLVDGVQLSVGCQFRGGTVPQIRPVCEAAVSGAEPAP